MKRLIFILAFGLVFFSRSPAQDVQKHRVIILTDIEADPDDTQSMVRLLLYSNMIDIEGLVATTSVWKKTSVAPESIRKIIRAYGKVQPNLLKHEDGFPEPASLLSKVKQGLPEYGMPGVGNGQDSEGSDWIINVLEKDDARPLWISVWGGVNTLAQALYKIRNTRPEAVTGTLISKLRVYAISDQDDSGIWIRKNFPDLFYIVSPGDDYGSATWNAINSYVQEMDNQMISNPWLARHIQQGHGPLGAAYPDVSWGMEGDTPSWLNLIPNGLNNPEHPDWGGWGGRYELYKPDFSTQRKGGSGVPFEPEPREIWTDATDRYTPYDLNEFGRSVSPDTVSFTGNKVTLWRWREDFQNDFAARMNWCTQSYEEANHPPVPVLSNPGNVTVKPGQYCYLDAFDSYDPDGDSFSFLWFNYPEAGTYKKPIQISGAENAHGAGFSVPVVDREVTAHFILKITDKGEPPLTRYQRIIVTITP